MKPLAIMFVGAMLIGPTSHWGADIEVGALTLRLEDAVTHQPVAGIGVYRLFETERVRHFLGIRGVPSPEGITEVPVAEHYVTDGSGEVKFPGHRVAARLYEVGLGDVLYINLVAVPAQGDVRDAPAFAKQRWRVVPGLHFAQSITQDDPAKAGVILHLHASLPDGAPMFDGAYARFALKRTGDRVVVRLASAQDGKVDGRLSSVGFEPAATEPNGHHVAR